MNKYRIKAKGFKIVIEKLKQIISAKSEKVTLSHTRQPIQAKQTFPM